MATPAEGGSFEASKKVGERLLGSFCVVKSMLTFFLGLRGLSG